ncbi:hypothetical protein G9A89_021376 [Geosiphon pyriformis]|nr:hypothetical protein G9A89_021376 [Geosiphon pyriformis]
MESQAGLSLFLAAGAFVDDTIWVDSSQAATQHILNVASEFFHLNDISINNNKTVSIPINCQVAAPYLTISSVPISITKRGEPHQYLGIFLFSEGLLKPSLVKAHLNVWFFVNLILRKVISDKQLAYLVSSVLFPIVSYRTQFSFIPLSVYNKWDTLVCKNLKSKSGLPLDFSNDAFHHPSLYNLKTFEQIQAESKSASVITFANSVGVLGCLFSHRSHDLQVLSWCPHYPLLFPVYVGVSPSNNFLNSFVTKIALFLIGRLLSVGKNWTPMAQSPPDLSSLGVCGSSDICQSFGFDVICNDLLNVGAACLSVYTNGSLSNLGTVDMLAGAAVFFENIDLGLGVRVSGLVSFTLAELQAIALALECVLSSHSVDLFSDSQVAIDAYRSESLLAGPDFKNCCWIERRHITNVIHCKNLDVNWIKVKGHSGVSGNEHANALAKEAVFSAWHLPHLVSERFLKAGINMVSGNSRHFVHNIFRSIHHAHWEVGSGSRVVPGCMHADIDWLRSSLVWYPDFHMATGFTSTRTAGFCTYFMKAFHHRLPVAMQKCLYDRVYLSVVCLFCGEVEVSDHVFSCSFDADSHTDLSVSMALCKDFVFGDWYCESVSVYKNPKVAVVEVVDFVQEFCLAFRDNIWLVRVKHRAIMERNKLILHDGFISVTVSGFSTWFLAGVIRLLGIANALGISFGYCKHCLFYAGVGDMAFIHISV